MAESRLKDIKILHRERLLVRDFFLHYGKDLQMACHSDESSLEVPIAESGIHRPGLAMAGFTKVYSSQQIQVVGHTEWNYLESCGARHMIAWRPLNRVLPPHTHIDFR